MSPLLWGNGVFRLYPNWLIYLFLAVFAFFSPFCYAKTAFSYSPDILSPCTPDVTMVKNVVKSVSEKMICGHHFEMWKCISKLLRRQRRNAWKAEKQYTNHHMWSNWQTAAATMWSGTDQITWSNHVVGAENHTQFLPQQVLYCNSSSSRCQGPLKIKIITQNLIRSKQRKSSLRSSPSSRR